MGPARARTTRAAVDAARSRCCAAPPEAPLASTLEEIVAHRVELLTALPERGVRRSATARSSQRVAERERAASRRARRARRAPWPATTSSCSPYKDEYEVARLYTDGSFAAQLAREFEGDYRLQLHLSPQFLPAWLAPRDPETGRVKKWRIPAALIFPFFRVLRRAQASCAARPSIRSAGLRTAASSGG